jgi:hypothetical protein
MTLGNELAAEDNAEQPDARVDWDGTDGYIQTGAVEDDFNPQDLSGILQSRGLDPERFRVTSQVGFSSWDQVSRNRTTGEYERRQLRAFKFHFVERAWCVDLPALYAEVAKTKPKPSKPKTGDATVVVCWADIQTGKVDHLGGLQELLQRLDEKRAALDAYLKRSSFDHIVIADAGDILEGFDNFPAQTRTNSLSLMDQVDVAATEFWKTIRLCARRAPVDVLTIPSNHCAWRRGGKALAGKVGDDWGLHVSKRLERHNEEASLPVTFHRSGEWDETLQFDVRGTKLGLAHGHQANNPDQVKNWWAKMSHAGVLDCQVLVTGHFHFPSMRPSGKTPDGRSKWHVQASTLDNGSSWVRNKYGEDGDPALTVFQINEGGFDVTSFALL